VILDNPDGRFKPGMYAEAILRVPVQPDGSADPAASHATVLAVPAEAVLTTGMRQLVYREVEPGKYQAVAPKLGPRAGDYYPVVSGLKEGDKVVTRGSFLLDSQFQITGKTSLIGPPATWASAEIAASNDGFTAKERANIEKLAEKDRKLALAQRLCPITGEKLGSMGKPYKMSIRGRTLYLCCEGCQEEVKRHTEVAFEKIDGARR
jgi:YHS domain-containing protein